MTVLRRVLLMIIFIIGLLPIPGQASVASSQLSPAQMAQKVDPWVLQTAAVGETEFLVYMTEQTDLSGAAALPTKQEKGAYVYQKLSETARRTQGPLLALLQQAGAAYQPFWVANMVLVRGGRALANLLAQRPDVAHLYANPSVQADMGVIENAAPQAVDVVNWDLTLVKADQLWAAGYTGQGVVIGGQDTGYDWNHPALHAQYRGVSAGGTDHNYNWHDAIHAIDPHQGGSNPCGLDTQAPCDDYGHGTHTMGSMVGDDGATHKIGMAPGARWIGCRNMERGWGKPSTYAECYQWFIAPTTLDPNNPQPDPSKAPDIINNSWGCTYTEGCADPTALLSVVRSVTAAGILTVHSAGNGGHTACGTISEPAAIYAESFTVANTDQNDSLNPTSSIGPVSIDSSGRRKPDIAAPGTLIYSSVPGNAYQTMTGTSMSSPHVAGLAALLISAAPGLAGHVDVLRQVIQQAAFPGVKVTNAPASCGGTTPAQIPNNYFGWGRIDASQALRALAPTGRLDITPHLAFANQMITYTLTVSNNLTVPSPSSLVISQTLPANLSQLNATPGYTQAGSTLVWKPGSLPASTSQQFRASGTAGQLLCLNNAVPSAKIASNNLPGVPLFGALEPFSGVGINFQGPTSAYSDQQVTYTYTLQTGAPTASFVFSATVPTGARLASAYPAFTLSGSALLWTVPALGAGNTWQLSLTLDVQNLASSPLALNGAIQTPGLSICRAPAVVTKITWRRFVPLVSK